MTGLFGIFQCLMNTINIISNIYLLKCILGTYFLLTSLLKLSYVVVRIGKIGLSTIGFFPTQKWRKKIVGH